MNEIRAMPLAVLLASGYTCSLSDVMATGFSNYNYPTVVSHFTGLYKKVTCVASNCITSKRTPEGALSFNKNGVTAFVCDRNLLVGLTRGFTILYDQ